MYITNAIINDTDAIAKLHIECFPDYFLTKFGAFLLGRYYSEYIKEGAPFILAKEDEKVVGFCMGYTKSTSARKNFIKNNAFRLICKSVGLLFTFDKEVYRKIWSNIIPQKKKESSEIKVDGDLLSICVAENQRGKGISSELVAYFEKELIKSGCKNYTLSVNSDNERGIAFYRKMGMQPIYSNRGSIKFYKDL